MNRTAPSHEEAMRWLAAAQVYATLSAGYQQAVAIRPIDDEGRRMTANSERASFYEHLATDCVQAAGLTR